MTFITDLIRMGIVMSFILFLPGYMLSLAFFNKTLDTVERLASAFCLSVSILPIIAIWANLIGIELTAGFVLATAAVVANIGFLIYWFRFKYQKK